MKIISIQVVIEALAINDVTQGENVELEEAKFQIILSFRYRIRREQRRKSYRGGSRPGEIRVMNENGEEFGRGRCKMIISYSSSSKKGER